jgi:hypothetical protein
VASMCSAAATVVGRVPATHHPDRRNGPRRTTTERGSRVTGSAAISLFRGCDERVVIDSA